MTISKPRTIGLMVVAASMLVVLIHSNGLIAAEPRPGTEEVAKDTKERSQLILRDDFDGKLTLNWKPVRFDHTHLSVTKNPGKLTITTQQGSIFGDETHDAYGEGVQAKNLFLIENPFFSFIIQQHSDDCIFLSFRSVVPGSVATRHQATPAQVALAWLLRQERLIVIPKAGTLKHVRENRAALDVQLTDADLAELDREFPRPTRKKPLEML